MNCLQYCNYKQ